MGTNKGNRCDMVYFHCLNGKWAVNEREVRVNGWKISDNGTEIGEKGGEDKNSVT